MDNNSGPEPRIYDIENLPEPGIENFEDVPRKGAEYFVNEREQDDSNSTQNKNITSVISEGVSTCSFKLWDNRTAANNRRRELWEIKSEGCLEAIDLNTINTGNRRMSHVSIMVDSDLSSWPSDSDITVLRVKMKRRKYKWQLRKEWGFVHDGHEIPGEGSHLGESLSLVNLATLVFKGTDNKVKDESIECILPVSSWEPNLSQKMPSDTNVLESIKENKLKSPAGSLTALKFEEIPSSSSATTTVTPIYELHKKDHDNFPVQTSSTTTELCHPSEVEILNAPTQALQGSRDNKLEFLLHPLPKHRRSRIIRFTVSVSEFLCPCMCFKTSANK